MYLAASGVKPDLHLLGHQVAVDLFDQQVDDLDQVVVGERGEQDHFVQAVQEFGIERLLHFAAHHVFDLARERLRSAGAEKPRWPRFSRKRAPRFEVMMMMVFLKSTVLPRPSVNWPSSNTCSRML